MKKIKHVKLRNKPDSLNVDLDIIDVDAAVVEELQAKFPDIKIETQPTLIPMAEYVREKRRMKKK